VDSPCVRTANCSYRQCFVFGQYLWVYVLGFLGLNLGKLLKLLIFKCDCPSRVYWVYVLGLCIGFMYWVYVLGLCIGFFRVKFRQIIETVDF
jgi:hypothetical protein